MYYQQVDINQMPRTIHNIRTISNDYQQQITQQQSPQQQSPHHHQQQQRLQLPQQRQQYLPPAQLQDHRHQHNLLQQQLSVIQQHFQAFQLQQHDSLYAYQPFQQSISTRYYDQHEQHQRQPNNQQSMLQHLPTQPDQQLLPTNPITLELKQSQECRRSRKDSSGSSSPASSSSGHVVQSARITRVGGRSSRADGKPKRVRTIFTPEQLRRLEQFFSSKSYLVAGDRNQLADELCLTEAQVKVWFQNRRIKARRIRPGDPTPVPKLD